MAGNYELGNLIWKIKGDTKDYDKKLKSADQQTKKFGGSLSDSAKKLVKYGVAAGAAALSIGKIVSTVKESIKLYGVQVTAERTLAAAIESTGESADTLLPKYKDLASSIQAVTTEGDESTLALIQQATSLGVNSEKIEEATKGAIGLSKSLGIGTQQAIRGVANALEGNFTSLQRYIPALRTTEDESEKLAIVQKAMAEGFEVAKAEADSGFGALQQYENAVGDLKEQLGEAVVEGIKPLVGGLTTLITKWAGNIAETKKFKKALAEIRQDDEEFLQEAAVADLELALAAANDELEKTRKQLQGRAVDIERATKTQRELIASIEEELEKKRKLAEAERIRQKILDKYGDKSQEYYDYIETKQALELAAAERLEEIRQQSLSSQEKELEELQTQINYWAQYRGEIEGAEETFQALAKRRNEIYAELREQNEENKEEEIESIDTITDYQLSSLDIRSLAVGEFYDKNKEKRKEDQEDEEQTLEEKVQMYARAFNAINGIVGQAFDVRLMQLDNEEERTRQLYDAQLQALQKKFDNEEISEEDFKKQKLAIEKEKAKEIYDIQLEQFNAQKEIDIIQAGISTARMAIEAYKSLVGIPVIGPGLAVGAAALATSFGLAQIQEIQNQPAPAPPAFADGGFVQPRPGVPATGDRVNARLNPREVVLTESDANELLSAIRGGGLGVTINQYNTLNTDSEKNMERAARQLYPYMTREGARRG